MKPLLDLTDVNYTYQTAEGETPAVKNLSFRVFPGSFSRYHRSERMRKIDNFIPDRRFDPA